MLLLLYTPPFISWYSVCLVLINFVMLEECFCYVGWKLWIVAYKFENIYVVLFGQE